jgi:hypothetical protein
MNRARVSLLIISVLVARAAGAGQNGLPPTYDGPPAPTLPETIARDASGKVTVRAVRLTSPLRVDGRLDEAIYNEIVPMSGFIQTEPVEGMPATERTDIWIFFDRDNIYVTARCWETHPERMVANEMRRDNGNLFNNETFSFIFDTFYDRRNADIFIINPLGGRTDAQVTNERNYTRDWNPVWDVKTGRFDGGWIVEAAVPFKSLRYQPGEQQLWGFNARRVNRWKNELSHLTPIPNALGFIGLWHASLAATMVGLEVPTGAKNLEFKPYAIASTTTDLTATPTLSNHPSWDSGLDAKYGVSRGLTADFTVNTDFAQVEADEQQVNLTRFSLFFPEKRDFFLENQGLWGFGGISVTSGFGGFSAASNVPILFYSRRIGLSRPDSQGREVPLEAGARLTGRTGRFNVGALDIQTGDERVSGVRATNFSAVRIKRDLLRRSSVGAIFTGRSIAQSGGGTNQTYGVDGTFAFYDNLAVNTYWARTDTDGFSNDDTSYRAQLDYTGDRYGVQLDRVAVGSHFNPEVGYVRRPDMRQTFGLLRFSPRPTSIKSVRKFSWVGSGSYIENGAGRPETREWDGEFSTEFQNSDRFSVGYNHDYEFVPRPFRVGPGVAIPVGAYDLDVARVKLNFGQQRRIFGDVLAEHGTFYGGNRTTLSVTSGRVSFSTQLSIEPSYTVNRVALPRDVFTSHLVGSRVIYTMTPLMFATALLQYNSDTRAMSANVRLRWEYRPGSELFVVFNEERDAHARSFPDLTSRAFIVKINRLFRF